MPDTLVVTCPLEEKEMLMAAAPGIYFETDHYKGWPAVLVRIKEIEADELRHRLRKAWLMQAPKRLAKKFLAGERRLIRGCRPAADRAGSCRSACSSRISALLRAR